MENQTEDQGATSTEPRGAKRTLDGEDSGARRRRRRAG